VGVFPEHLILLTEKVQKSVPEQSTLTENSIYIGPVQRQHAGAPAIASHYPENIVQVGNETPLLA
jgi:hypothetical protein